MIPRPLEILDLLKTLHARIRTRVAASMHHLADPAAVVRETAGDTLYAIDVDIEPLWDYPPFQELIEPKG